MRHIFLVAAAISGNLLCAQERTVAAQSPQPLLRVEVLGPAGWRQLFSPTNLGSLLDSEAGRKVWQPLTQLFELKWQGLLGDAKEFGAARTRLLDYSGRVEFLLWMQPPAKDHGDPTFTCALLWNGDGHTDLEALGRDLETVAGKASNGAWKPEKIEGRDLRVLEEDTSRATAPLRTGDRLVSAIAIDCPLEAAVHQVFASLPAEAPKNRLVSGPAFAVHLDVPTACRIAQQSTNRENAAMMQAVGLTALDTLDFTVQTAGPQVMLELAQAFHSDDRGLLGAFFPKTTGLPGMLTLVPKENQQWKVGHFDLARAYEAIETGITAYTNMSKAQLRETVSDELGCDPVADLLSHLGEEVLLLGAPEDLPHENKENGTCIVFMVRDDKAFRAGFDKACKKGRTYFDVLETSQHEGAEILRMGGLFSGNYHIGFGRGLWILGFGADSEERVAKVLDAAKAHAPTPTTEVPDAWKSLGRFAPPGLNGLAEADVLLGAKEVATYLELYGELLPRDLLPRFHGSDVQLDEITPLLQTHHLDRLRTLTGFADQKWRLRLFW